MLGNPNRTEKNMLIPVVLLSVLGIVSYFWYGMILGRTDHKIYITCLLSIMMYLSIIKYVYDYYCKGKGNVGIYALLIRYSVAVAGTLISLHKNSSSILSDTDMLFILILVVLMLVPYVTGNLTNAKHNVPLMIVITIIVTAIAVFRLSGRYIPNPLLAYGKWGIFAECFNKISQSVQWYSFTIIYLLRWQERRKSVLNETAANKY